MVPQTVRNGLNTHVIIDTNPPINRPVGQSRSISTVGSVPPTGQHGRYRRSVRSHLRRITVDRRSSIIDRNNFVIGWTDDTCAINDSYVPQLQLRNERTPPDFESFFLENRPWKRFSTNVLIRGEMNPLHKHKIMYVTSVKNRKSALRDRILFASTEVIHRSRSDSPLHFHAGTLYFKVP